MIIVHGKIDIITFILFKRMIILNMGNIFVLIITSLHRQTHNQVLLILFMTFLMYAQSFSKTVVSPKLYKILLLYFHVQKES